MEGLHKSGVEVIEIVQSRLQGLSEILVWVSWIGDPRYAFLVYFPVMFAFHWPTGIRVLWTTVITEWVNHVMKWILYGERPYWWIRENESLWTNQNLTAPKVQQFQITCETGPGSPSGHMMIASATWFVIVNYFAKMANKNSKNLFSSTMIWTAYTYWVIAVGISRVFIAAHFPHQCIAGLLAGIILGYTVNKVPIERISLRCHFIFALGMLFTALGAYTCLRAIGMDPSWTIPLAIKWCSKRSWVHLTTNPFYSMWRYVGSLIGVGLGMHSPLHNSIKNQPSTNYSRYVSASISLVIALVWDRLMTKIHPDHLNLAYSICFVKSILIPYLVIALIPWTVRVLESALKESRKNIIQIIQNRF